MFRIFDAFSSFSLMDFCDKIDEAGSSRQLLSACEALCMNM